jgi:DNA-binding YbaB/EbfC family protein
VEARNVNIGKMMKDLQKMQSKLQAEIEEMEVESSAGGGMVTARMSGKKELLSIKLSPEMITPDDPELLEDLIIAAVNEAGRKVDAELQEKTAGLTGGMNIPGLT